MDRVCVLAYQLIITISIIDCKLYSHSAQFCNFLLAKVDDASVRPPFAQLDLSSVNVCHLDRRHAVPQWRDPHFSPHSHNAVILSEASLRDAQSKDPEATHLTNTAQSISTANRLLMAKEEEEL